jgi:Uncharacterized conserved protein
MDDDDGLAGREPETLPGGAGAAQEAVGAAVRYWWISVLRGGLALLLGIGALISGASDQLLVNYIALYWLLGGLLTIRWALGVKWRAGSRLGLAAGLLATAMGLVLIARHRLEDIVSPEALIGAVAVTTDGNRMSQDRRRVRGRGAYGSSVDHRRDDPGVGRGRPRGDPAPRQEHSRIYGSPHDRHLGPRCGIPAPRAGVSDAASASGAGLTSRTRT